MRKGVEVGERFYLEQPQHHCRPRSRMRHLPERRHGVARACGPARATAPTFTLEDAGSLNGTYVNDVIVTEATLRSGDTRPDRTIPDGVPQWRRCMTWRRRVRDYMTIGEVVEKLLPAHPDLTISKVRFLEDERLISPERTPGGYRKYRPADVQRLELVLRLQKDHFMPLAVIREKLDDLDRGKMPPELRPAVEQSEAMTLPLDDAETVPLDRVPDMLGLPTAFIRELASFGIVTSVTGEQGDELPRPGRGIAHTAGSSAGSASSPGTCACMRRSRSARPRSTSRS